MDSTEPIPPTPAGLLIPAEVKSYFRRMAKWCRLTGIGGILAVIVLIASLYGFFWGVQIGTGGHWSKEARILFTILFILLGEIFLLTIYILMFSSGMFRAAYSDRPRDTRNALEQLLTYLRVAGVLSVFLLLGFLMLVTALIAF